MDIEDLKACLERHHRESYGWARFCCRHDADEADNVLQTVYLKILERRAVYGGNATFRTWLFGVIRITAAELRRGRMLRKLQLLRYGGSPSAPTHTASAEDTVYQFQLATGLRKAMGALPRRQAEVLQLVFYHDLSLAEAAEATGASLGSVRTHYDRGKRRLRLLLGNSAWRGSRE